MVAFRSAKVAPAKRGDPRPADITSGAKGDHDRENYVHVAEEGAEDRGAEKPYRWELAGRHRHSPIHAGLACVVSSGAKYCR